ncbi:chain length determinant protein EpsF [Herminiimonas fonticola]|uniref:Chain length determinant protein EpsF n=1 Tax=Herminiimonas fonticola TaxID=303380 RepID=A0A4R6G4Z8_9BURK|nr:chain length determinant protein EpsF [Herminiimonas fonticola]RBA23009.1 EpsF: chain length determinant protein EpsF [Herminiimonas fonticola]TDN89549.1 chain length determinant protein EpsF [Herminiimonas fonticola]
MTLAQILRTLRARYKIVLLLLVVTVVAAFAVSLLMPKTYKATTSLVLNNKGIDPVTGLNVPVQLTPGYLPTQVDIVKSKVVALKVVEDLKLAEDPAVKARFAKLDHSETTIQDWLSDGLRANLTVEPARDSSVLNVSVKGDDAEYVAKIANAFAAAYQQVSVDLKVAPAQKASGYINDQIKVLREKFETAQNKMSAYQKEKNIFSSDNKLDVETARLNELSSQLVVAQGLSMEAASRQRQVKSNAGGSPDVLANPLIQSLKSRLSEAEAKFADTSAKLNVNHPQYIAAKSEVDNLRASLNQQIDLASTGVASNARIQQQREAEVRAALNAQKEKVLALNSARDELSVLSNEMENAKRAYETASQRLTQTNLEGQSTQSDISVLTAASVPRAPAGPRMLLNLLLALVVGSILGIAAAIAMELLDQRVRSADDLTQLFGLPLLGVIEKTRVVRYRPQRRLGGTAPA